jgi:hypothetical protein
LFALDAIYIEAVYKPRSPPRDLGARSAPLGTSFEKVNELKFAEGSGVDDLKLECWI